MISTKLIHAVRTSKLRSYEIAHEAGLHPSTLSKIINGIDLIKMGDSRVISIGRVLGISPAECFRPTCGIGNDVAEKCKRKSGLETLDGAGS